MRKTILIILTIIFVIIIIGIIIWRYGALEKSQPEIMNFKECILAGYLVLESYPRQCRTPEGEVFTEDIGNELDKLNLIRVANPRPNDLIKSPLNIRGEARGFWFFEADFPVKLLDGDSNLIAITIAQAQSDWMTEEFVSFEAKLDFPVPATENGTLILEKDNPSGLPKNADELRIPVRFNLGDITKVKIYFNNNKLDPEFSCNKVFPVERKIFKTQAVARSALTELLRGPTEEEKSEGYFTSINPGVKIQSLIIGNGTAKVDFDEQLEFQVGGSCRVAAIRAQITETLKQFPTINNVIISINGRTEEILQP